jgi:hypothetical protein
MRNMKKSRFRDEAGAWALEDTQVWKSSKFVNRFDAITGSFTIGTFEKSPEKFCPRSLDVENKKLEDVVDHISIKLDSSEVKRTFVSESPADCILSRRDQILGDCFQFEPTCLDKFGGFKTPTAFDLSSLLLLSISPKR